MSFLLDPPLLAATGAVVERLVPEEHKGVADAVVLGVFVGASYGLYLNVPGLEFIWRPMFKGEDSHDFMLRSGILPRWPVRSEKATNALAAAMFSLYPAWYVLGRRLARRRG